MTIRFKFLPLAVAILLTVCAVWPARAAKAAYLTEFNIDTKGKNYLIAGMEYKVSFRDDAHFTTKKKIELSFSTVINKYTFSLFQAPYSLLKDGTLRFTIPYDSMITNAAVGLHVSFYPILGESTRDNSYSASMPVYQPMDPSDLEAIANDDGTVTLNWYDNSNMESQYVITRSGPDGDKQFTVDNTMGTVGPLTFTDKTTNKDKDTIYMYKLNMMIDIGMFQGTGFQYEPVNVYRLVKTKAPAKEFKIDPTSVPKLPDLSNTITKPTLKDLIVRKDLVLNNSNTYQHIVDQLNKEGKVIPGVDNDLVPVTSVKLGSKSLSIQPGDQVALISTVVPDNAANKKVSWESSNPAVAKVDNDGKVTGVTPGTAKITVKTDEGGFVAVCIATVNEPAAELAGNIHEDENKLTDIADHPAKAEIMTAVDLGIVSGYTDHTFKPERNISRAEFAVMLMKAISTNVAVDALAFNDKDKIEEWAAAPIAKAVKLGIITGYSDGTFRPDANITHAEMIAMVVRASSLTPDAAAKTTFADDSDIPDWARPAVATAQLNGIIIVGGKPNDKFAPGQLSTRAEAASAIIKMLAVKK
ncbi:S-layer homology domain-containing protein [Gordoniibacillus kamchatkensis]|uniref:S-layer homology domain-containing protein n=1 Tax=Gordoniibacillus kamchatkensis TaxID=1590651 RepID=UPI000696EAE8|nr:S-layer homology domain-containing protein [Paenibacillus sp. VKM B-2647]